MQDIQQIFDQIQELKMEQKDIRTEYKDALENADKHSEITEKIKELREEKKKIEAIVQGNMGSRWNQFETAKNKLAELQEMLTDIAMTTLMDGKSISLKDKQEHEYEPVYKVTFKKLT